MLEPIPFAGYMEIDMNNEPVAWRTHYPSGWEYKDGNPPFELKGNSQLLYTHPAKTLTDEEIIGAIARGWCSEKNSSKTMDSDLAMAIANEIRAILRKATE